MFTINSSKLFILRNVPNNTQRFFILKGSHGDDILAHVVTETNRYASQKLAAKPDQLAKWKDVLVPELKVYFGVCIVMGINSLPCTADYWSSDPNIGNEGINNVRTKNRFQEITWFLHFNDSSVEPPRDDENYDRLYKVRSILSAFNDKMLAVYKPNKYILVGEGMVAFKDRLSFRLYMPAKPTKYGIKVWIPADASYGFVLNHKLYLRKERNAAHHSAKMLHDLSS